MDRESAHNQLASTPASNNEVELKLRAHPDTFEQILNAPVLADSAAGTGSRETLEAAYFDTPDLRLHRRGLSFRVRMEGDRYIQTIKVAKSAAGALQRREWNVQVPGMAPYPDWLTEPEARSQLGFFADGELLEIFRTIVERETRVIGFNGAVIEVAFDRGNIECGGRMVPLAEVELELLKGDQAALYALALELQAFAPLHVETRSKPDRAYALVTKEAPGWVKGAKPSFPEDVSVDAAMGIVFQECFAHWLANEPAALDGTDPEGVHQMRVALRRLRSALTIFNHVIPSSQREWLQSETKWIANSLGPARDWDVFVEELLARLQGARPDDHALATLGRKCEKIRQQGYQTARSAIHSARYTRHVLRFGEWLDRKAWRHGADPNQLDNLNEPLNRLADRLLSCRHRKVRKLGRDLKHAPAEARHNLRLGVKKLRYSTEFFASLFPARKTKAYTRIVSQLQDTLGILNDVSEYETRLQSVNSSGLSADERDELMKAIGMVIGWSTENATHVESGLFDQWARFKQTKVFWKPVRKPVKTRHAESSATPAEPVEPEPAPSVARDVDDGSRANPHLFRKKLGPEETAPMPVRRSVID